MYDLFVLFDGRSYYNRNELKKSLNLKECSDSNEEELYFDEGKKYFIVDFTNDPNDYNYSEDELNKIPYKVAGACHIAFYPFDAIYDVLPTIIDFNGELFIDDDNGNIVNICEYKELVKKKKVFPFTYYSKKYLKNT